MKYPHLIIVPAIMLAMSLKASPRAKARTGDQPAAASVTAATDAAPATQGGAQKNDAANARKARALLDQAIQALGGEAFLNIRNMQQQGRTYSFHHGQPTSNGVLFWRFLEYPDKERIEITKERDIAEVFAGDKGYEVTYKGPRAIEKKDLDDYLRRRKFSLETVVRVWRNDSTVAFFYDGQALAGNLPAEQITLINAKDEAVSLYFDVDTHLPIKKRYVWRDPVDRERNVEEEIYDNYRSVEGVMTPYGFTRYYNGDMQSERFVNSVTYNQELNPAMFDANSGYNPNKPSGKH